MSEGRESARPGSPRSYHARQVGHRPPSGGRSESPPPFDPSKVLYRYMVPGKGRDPDTGAFYGFQVETYESNESYGPIMLSVVRMKGPSGRVVGRGPVAVVHLDHSAVPVLLAALAVAGAHNHPDKKGPLSLLAEAKKYVPYVWKRGVSRG